MASTLNIIKQRIRENLEVLQREETIRDIQVDDFRKSIFDRNYSAFPVAILTTPSVESAADTNDHNLRAYTFEIVIIMKAEDVQDPAQVEDLIEEILNQFDNDVQLKGDQSSGIADGGVMPSTSTPQGVTNMGISYVVFSVILRVRALRQITLT